MNFREKPTPETIKNSTENQYGFRFEISKRFLKIDNEENLLEELSAIQWMDREKLGVGFNAEVYPLYVDGVASALCVKKIKKLPETKVNSIYEEAEFQAEAEKVGVTTPRYVMALRDVVTRQEYVVMERIDGYSIKDCLDPHGDAQAVIPDTYNHEKFFTELKAMLDKMHEAKIHHRDLHAGNIMVTKDGAPVIIDFGSAGYSHGLQEDFDIYRVEGRVLTDREKGIYSPNVSVVSTDEQNVKSLEQELRKYFA